jgi:hypothetical protein
VQIRIPLNNRLKVKMTSLEKITYLERKKSEIILKSCLFDVRYFRTHVILETQLFLVQYDKQTGKFLIE